jgi:hypothetical protein
MRNKSFLIFAVLLALLPLSIGAQTLGETAKFNIQGSYDASGRSELQAELVRTSLTAYWYMDSDYLAKLASADKEAALRALDSLASDFETTIYPRLTGAFGQEWKPGIDKDTKITILLHPMEKGAGGYINTADEYPKAQIPESNEREMLYLDTNYLATPYAKSFLAHELTHLITFNQKDRTFGVAEETWLNEARAEYAPTLAGYDDEYEGSNLQARVRDFLNNPSDSLVEWRERPADYGVANLFVHYLVDHYGTTVLADSLKIKKTGIDSLNAVLAKQGFSEDFAQIFDDWTIATLINDCHLSDKYCYFNQNLKNFRVTPLINYLPFIGKSTLSVTNTTKDWAGNWHKFIGGQGTLTVEFSGGTGVFRVPYVITKNTGENSVGYLTFALDQPGEITIGDFGSENIALTIIPIAQNKTTDFSGLELSRMFSWTASTKQEEEIILPALSPLIKPISQMSRAEIFSRIAEIQAIIARLQEIMVQLGSASCTPLTQNLYFGMTNNVQVMCLQDFLKNQGASIYPEGIVNGNFYNATLQAVIRFQGEYGIEATGFVGSLTRAKINSLLSQ